MEIEMKPVRGVKKSSYDRCSKLTLKAQNELDQIWLAILCEVLTLKLDKGFNAWKEKRINEYLVANKLKIIEDYNRTLTKGTP